MKNFFSKGFLLNVVFLGMITGLVNAQAKEYFPDPNPAIQKKLEDWKDLKFGLLMHWGPYSQWSIVESWSLCPEDVGWATGARVKKDSTDDYYTYKKKYEGLKNTFNPTNFDPAKWAAAAKDAGMKYVVFTTKHHDGFCMFDTKTTDYKVTDPGCPYSVNSKSNITKEVFNAFRNENMWVGAYFSKPDWHSNYYWWDRFPPIDRNVNYPIKHYPQQWQKFVDYTYKQIDELMSNYGKVDILWLDGGWVRKKSPEEEKSDVAKYFQQYDFNVNGISQDIDIAKMAKMARVKQPDLIVVDRDVPGEQQNYLTPEQHIPDEGLPYPWETCMTMAGSWSYVANDKYKSLNDLLFKLVDIVSKGGNFLLNIGPSPEGELPQDAYIRLRQIGAWLKVNGEAIYGTRMHHVYGEGDSIRYTQNKEGTVKYIFIMKPTDRIVLTKFNMEGAKTMKSLSTGKKIAWKKTNTGLELNGLPKGNSDQPITVIKVF